MYWLDFAIHFIFKGIELLPIWNTLKTHCSFFQLSAKLLNGYISRITIFFVAFSVEESFFYGFCVVFMFFWSLLHVFIALPIIFYEIRTLCKIEIKAILCCVVESLVHRFISKRQRWIKKDLLLNCRISARLYNVESVRSYTKKSWQIHFLRFCTINWRWAHTHKSRKEQPCMYEKETVLPQHWRETF